MYFSLLVLLDDIKVLERYRAFWKKIVKKSVYSEYEAVEINMEEGDDGVIEEAAYVDSVTKAIDDDDKAVINAAYLLIIHKVKKIYHTGSMLQMYSCNNQQAIIHALQGIFFSCAKVKDLDCWV
jgi:hypothetical protein